ncbi:phage minor head protein [Microvirgula curvata]
MVQKNNDIDLTADERRVAAKKEKARQIALGITHYRWSSSHDESVCERCTTNYGKVFRWDEPPPTGHPGEGRFCSRKEGCRCIAIPVFNQS